MKRRGHRMRRAFASPLLPYAQHGLLLADECSIGTIAPDAVPSVSQEERAAADEYFNKPVSCILICALHSFSAAFPEARCPYCERNSRERSYYRQKIEAYKTQKRAK